MDGCDQGPNSDISIQRRAWMPAWPACALIAGLARFFFGPKESRRAELPAGVQEITVTVKGSGCVGVPVAGGTLRSLQCDRGGSLGAARVARPARAVRTPRHISAPSNPMAWPLAPTWGPAPTPHSSPSSGTRRTATKRMGHSSITVTLDRYGHLFPSLGRELAAGLDVRLPRSMERRMALGPVARSDHEVDDHSTGFSYHEEAVLIIGATTHLPRHTDHRHFYMPFGLRSGLGGVGERRPRPAVRFSGQGDVLGL